MDLDLLIYLMLGVAYSTINVIASLEAYQTAWDLAPPRERPGIIAGAILGGLICAVVWPIMFGWICFQVMARWWR